MAATVFTALLLSLLYFAAAIGASSSSSSSYTNYIQSSCGTTTYPSLCYRSLSPYASKVRSNPWKLCNTALSVSIQSARNTSTLISGLLKNRGLTKVEASIIKDCVENMGDSIDELKQSVKAMAKMSTGRNNSSASSSSAVEFQMSNVKTWVSAAITDENTCTDGFDGRKVSAGVKNKIRTSIVAVARLTSNALSLINGLKY